MDTRQIPRILIHRLSAIGIGTHYQLLSNRRSVEIAISGCKINCLRLFAESLEGGEGKGEGQGEKWTRVLAHFLHFGIRGGCSNDNFAPGNCNNYEAWT